MTVSNRRDILVALKSGFESITIANGFQSEVVEVRRGIYGYNDFGARPSISFWNQKYNNIEHTCAHEEKTLTIWVWGFVDVDKVGSDLDNLDRLVADVEKMLADSAYNLYADDTHIKDCVIYEGGSGYNFGMFEMEIEINFEHVRGAL